MACGSAIEKGKEVKKMKRAAAVAFIAALIAGVAVPVPLHKIAASPSAPVIVAFGDSLTAGLGLPRDQSFPAQLQASLTARDIAAKVVDAGVSGDTAMAALQRLDWALPDDADAVIIELGGNDALQGIPPDGTKAAIEKMIEKVQAKGLPILLAGQEAPRNMGKDYVDQFRALFADLAQRYDVIFYPFFLEGVALNDDLMQADGLHPNAKGVAVIVENIMPKVDELLAKVKAKN
jgi:acyl-CoA thioesterase-1